jgi:transposase
VSQGSNSGLRRGDRNRNTKLAVLRRMVPRDRLVLGIDLAQSKQAAVLADHDSVVIARWRPRCSSWELGALLDRARDKAVAAGHAGITVACEPTGNRWLILQQLAIERGIPLVCVQPVVTARARESEDYTRGKNDDKDATLIARLAAGLHCYVPERAGQLWGRLRHQGARRAELVTGITACQLRVRDLLEMAWPAVLRTAGHPLRSTTWLSCLTTATAEGGDGPGALHAAGPAAFAAAVRAGLARWDGKRISTRIVRAVHTALTDPAGVAAQRPGALERVSAVLRDWAALRGELDRVEAAMLQCLDTLELLGLAGSVPGVSPVSVAAILAETGDPARFSHARAMVKHAGLAPVEHSSGNRAGSAGISRRGRPGLRLAAWRAVWGALRHNPVYQRRYAAMTGRAVDPLTDQQARVAIAAALIRQIHAVVTRGVAWDAETAAGHRPPRTRGARRAA